MWNDACCVGGLCLDIAYINIFLYLPGEADADNESTDDLWPWMYVARQQGSPSSKATLETEVWPLRKSREA